jgi:hypothetical protein
MSTDGSENKKVGDGVRILSLGTQIVLLQDTSDNADGADKDSGGPGTYSQLLIIKEYMIRLAYDRGIDEGDVYPADYFDLMGGVGFGGYVTSYVETVSYQPFRLIAILLGHLRMNVDEAIKALLDVALAIFPGGLPDSDPDMRTRRLRESIEDILRGNGVPLDRKMQEIRGGCKVYV